MRRLVKAETLSWQSWPGWSYLFSITELHGFRYMSSLQELKHKQRGKIKCASVIPYNMLLCQASSLMNIQRDNYKVFRKFSYLLISLYKNYTLTTILFHLCLQDLGEEHKEENILITLGDFPDVIVYCYFGKLQALIVKTTVWPGVAVAQWVELVD